MQDFLKHFVFGEGLLAIATGHVANVAFHKQVPASLPTNTDVYFAPGVRIRQGMTKDDVLGSVAVWVDIDNGTLPTPLLPPSFVVMSGHGHHMYWLLDEPLRDSRLVEQYNQMMFTDIPTADKACWNANRLMRVPGTLNTKDPENPVRVQLLVNEPGRKYRPQDFIVMARIDPHTANRIKTGHTRGFKSRSERDWSVLAELRRNGGDTQLANVIFNAHLIGDKAREAPSYIEHTWRAIETKTVQEHPIDKGDTVHPQKAVAVAALSERPDGYWSGNKRLSTFLFDPELLLDGSYFHATDALIGTVSANGYKWPRITFSRQAFNEVRSMDKETPVAAWQWLGSEHDLRAMLPYYMDKLTTAGLPHVVATPTQGFHIFKGQALFVGPQQTLSAAAIWDDYKGPLHWLPSKREHPKLDLTIEHPNDELLELLRTELPKVQEPEVFWPMLGWYSAAIVKPWLEARNRRFPVLNVTGTKGSGKTTLIQRLFLPLFGQLEPKSYDAGTTKFVSLTLMGCSNAVPVAFSEFRFDSVQHFLRFVLLSYDTGHDPRGRPDQTTVDYPLSAPFSIDGEDLISDAAAQERMIVAQLRPTTVAERSPYHIKWKELRNKLPKRFAGWYIQHVLRLVESGELEALLKRAEADVFDSFEGTLPDRIRSNHIVVRLGILMWATILGIEPPHAHVLKRSLSSVVNMDVGRARTLSDEFIEATVDYVAQAGIRARFKWSLDENGSKLYVQMMPAHSWWIGYRRNQGKPALDLHAVKTQMTEAPYFAGTRVDKGAIMYGIDLARAAELGLDVVGQIDLTHLDVHI